MIDLNDVLLAMSNIPIDDPIAEIWGRGLQGGYKIIEYTGSLPITINANGGLLIDYRIYGASGGVGEPTENLFDINNTLENYYININTGEPIYFIYNKYVLSDYISIASSTVTISAKCIDISGSGAHWATYDENKTFISGGIAFYSGSLGLRNKVVDTSEAAFIRVDYALEYFIDCMLNPGSTAFPYEPYGYKLPMTVMNNLAPPLSQWVDGYITVNGNLTPPGYRKEKSSDFIEVKPNTQYVFSIEGGAFPQGTSGAWVAGFSYRDDRTPIKRASDDRNSPFTFLTPSETKYVRLSYRTYGELLEPRLSENSFSIPVYIGENQLGEDEYVSFSEQKIYRNVSGTLTPTDPPVLFHDIPTIKGETIIDYDGEPKPSQMYVKYKGKG